MQVEFRNEKIINVYDDIKNEEIDIRPDFQRGEVWSSSKKRMLIDSILRGWQVPPFHLITVEGGRSEVLDGQQRLTAIRDFIENKISIDGFIEPYDDEIASLNGLRYKNLSETWKRSFDRYLLIIYQITDYNQGEPGELFHRLNQSVKLTSSEQRNAFFGEIRDQTTHIVKYMLKNKVDKELVGFSNSRLAYNDLIARVGFYLENNSLRVNVTDKLLNSRSRAEKGFNDEIIQSMKTAINFLSKIRNYIDEHHISLNLTKASSFNWLYFLCEHSNNLITEYYDYMTPLIALETAKSSVKNNSPIPDKIKKFFNFEEKALRELMLLYIERSSSRVMTTASILIRDLIINIANFRQNPNQLKIDENNIYLLKQICHQLEKHDGDIKEVLETVAENWKISYERA